MSTNHKHVIDAVNTLGIWPENGFEVHRRLGNGPTNETWLVTHDNKRYVLRLVKLVAATLGLSLTEEMIVVTEAAKGKLAPPIIASCVHHGIVLSEYLDGRTWTVQDLHDRAQLDRLASALRRIHKLECKAPPLDIRCSLQRYAQRSTDASADMWLKNALAQLDLITPRPLAVCHNDLTVANLIDDGQLYMIDWEFAALGDPLFDLAVVIAHHELDAATGEYFLSTYLGRSDASAHANLVRWCGVYQNLLALWRSSL